MCVGGIKIHFVQLKMLETFEVWLQILTYKCFTFHVNVSLQADMCMDVSSAFLGGGGGSSEINSIRIWLSLIKGNHICTFITEHVIIVFQC
jgi:hypothetical protein